MKTSGNTILITGGGSGIGRALAHRWHDAGNVVIVAARQDTLIPAAHARAPRAATFSGSSSAFGTPFAPPDRRAGLTAARHGHRRSMRPRPTRGTQP